MVQIRVDQSDIQRIKNDMRHIRDGMPIAVMRAVNRVVGTKSGGIKKDVVDIAKRHYTAKDRRIRKNITVRAATKYDLRAHVASTGKPLKLIDFNVKPKTANPKRKKKLEVEVIKGQSKTLQHGFIPVLQHKGVFERAKGKWKKFGGRWAKVGEEGRAGRLPMYELEGPRIEDHYAKPEVMLEIQTKADKRLEAELNRQADYLFNQRMGLL